MIDALLSLLAPHYCCSCGEIGSLLCESCKYDIINESTDDCLLCGYPTLFGGCARCRRVVQRTWYASKRAGSIEKLINRYKFDNAKAAHTLLGDILLATLPDVPSTAVIVPVPTIQVHIRQRGYDHTLLVARYVAKRRNLLLKQCLARATASVQRGANRKQRYKQAKAAFIVQGDLEPDVPYLLIDDVVTTGATLTYGAKSMRSAGATEVWAAAIARQPFNEMENNRDK